MGQSVKRLVRDRLVNDATFRGLFPGVSTTASAPVSPVFMEQSATYPRVIYSEILGSTDSGMSGTNGQVTFAIQTQALSGVNPHVTTENIQERIDQLFDDQAVTGLAISGTSVYSYLFTREGGTDLSYNSDRKDYTKFITFGYKVFKY